MKLNISKFWMASTLSLCYLLIPKTVTAEENFISSNNFVETYQQTTISSVTQITENSDLVGSDFKENFTLSTAYLSNNTNHLNRNGETTVSKNLDIKSSATQQRTGLAAKSGKKPPRKG